MAEQEITVDLDDRVQETVDVWQAYSEALQAWTPKESLDEPDNSPEYLALKELDVRAEKLAWSLNPEERETVAEKLHEMKNTSFDSWLRINEEPLQTLENDPIAGLDESIDPEIRETIEAWVEVERAFEEWHHSTDTTDLTTPEYLALQEKEDRAAELYKSLDAPQQEVTAEKLAENGYESLQEWQQFEEQEQDLQQEQAESVEETIEQDPEQDINEQEPEETIDQSLDRDARECLAAWNTVNQLNENLEINKMEADLLKYEADSRHAVVDKGPEYSSDAKVLINTNERIKELEQQVKELREPTGNFLKDLSNEIKANHIENTELTRLQQSRNEMTLPGDGKSPNYHPNLKGEMQKADMEFKKAEIELAKVKMALDKKVDRVEKLSETRETNLEQAKERFNKLDQKQQQAVADRLASRGNNMFRQNMPEQAQQADLRAEQSQSQAAEQSLSQQASRTQEMAPMRER